MLNRLPWDLHTLPCCSRMGDLRGYHSLSSVTDWTSVKTQTRTITVKDLVEEEEVGGGVAEAEVVEELVEEEREEAVQEVVEQEQLEEVGQEPWLLEDQPRPREQAGAAPAQPPGPEVG